MAEAQSRAEELLAHTGLQDILAEFPKARRFLINRQTWQARESRLQRHWPEGDKDPSANTLVVGAEWK